MLRKYLGEQLKYEKFGFSEKNEIGPYWYQNVYILNTIPNQRYTSMSHDCKIFRNYFSSINASKHQ